MLTRSILFSLILLAFPLAIFAQETNSETSAEDVFAQRYFQAMMNYSPYDLPATYELACCFGALGDAPQAAEYLGKAIDLGFNDLWSVDRSVDFEPVRDSVEFQTVVEQLADILALRELDYGELGYFDTAAHLPYRIHLPAQFDSTEAEPLVIGLHGFGGNADWFGTLWQTFEDPGFIYAVPQAPYGVPNAGDVGFSWAILRHKDEAIYDKTLALSANNVMAFMADLQQQYNISEVYLLGFSQGGILAYNLAANNPSSFAGIACFASRLEGSAVTPDMISKNRGAFRVLIAHGLQDKAVKIDKGRAAYDNFIAAGYDVTWLEYDDGHTLPADALRKFQTWLEGD